MDIVELAGRLHEFADLGHVFGLHPALDHVAGGDPATDDKILADTRAHLVDGIEQEACPVLERAAILIGPFVFQRREKGGEQVTMGAVQFDPVETGLLCPLGGVGELVFDDMDLIDLERAGNDRRFFGRRYL